MFGNNKYEGDDFMFLLKRKTSFIKGILTGIAFGAVVGGFGVMLGGCERMKCIKKFGCGCLDKICSLFE